MSIEKYFIIYLMVGLVTAAINYTLFLRTAQQDATYRGIATTVIFGSLMGFFNLMYTPELVQVYRVTRTLRKMGVKVKVTIKK